MSLTRKFLAGLGLEADAISSIVQAHTDTLSGLQDELETLKAENARLKKDAEALPGVQKELDDLKAKTAADAKEREGKDYDKLKKEFDDYKAEQTRKEARAAKETAYKELLKDAGIPERHYAKILKYSDVDGVELDEKGKITGAKDILKAVKEEWADHIETAQTTGTSTANPPAATGTKTKEDILAIKDAGERQQAIAENHELFGF